ncbi:hypothetical protein [Brevundimonas sp. M20]|uniref:hypothetical protein n=1 Tax=Brevundimonas sp. M20 TaxID=2591463 RepID=UPI0011466D99|nr:hypothetical protein [Brevundimonas sp. M20]QDH72503.1 hypothetical protein FKQ52_03075 [Brevundimonas sp. M20]
MTRFLSVASHGLSVMADGRITRDWKAAKDSTMSVILEKESQIYMRLMEEVKGRSRIAADKILQVRSLPMSEGQKMVETESAILQIRFICELLALSSLALHSGLGLSNTLRKSWHADNIFTMLSDVNPNSFQTPIVLTRKDDGTFLYDNRKIPLDRYGVKKIYERCGGLLHRGVLKQVLEGKDRAYNLDQLDIWINRIVELLSPHSILFSKQNTCMIVMMSVPPNDRVQAYIVVGKQPGPLILP